MSRKYRPVLTDDDLHTINSALLESVERNLDSALTSPEDAYWAVQYRSHVIPLVERFSSLMDRSDDEVIDEEAEGQTRLEDLIEYNVGLGDGND